jgi:uncharacterized protein (TIGR00290 family)
MATLSAGFNMTIPKAWIAWSSGKDSAWALYRTLRLGNYEVVGALTTISEKYDRVSMHGVPFDMLAEQMKSMKMMGHLLYIPDQCTNEEYESRMIDILMQAKSDGVKHIIHGDIFLEDVKDYRDRQLARLGMEAVYPLWGDKSRSLAKEMVRGGLKAYLTCIEKKKVPEKFAGAHFDEDFLKTLPKRVDPCGENGEFHTFVYDCPMFRKALNVKTGESVDRDGFIYTDIVPAD